MKDFFGGFEVIKSFQIEKETEVIFGSCVKDVEESRYHSRFCESSRAKCRKGGEIMCNNLKKAPSAF